MKMSRKDWPYLLAILALAPSVIVALEDGNRFMAAAVAGMVAINLAAWRFESRHPARARLVVHLANAALAFLLARDYQMQGRRGLPWAWAAAGVVFLLAAMVGQGEGSMTSGNRGRAFPSKTDAWLSLTLRLATLLLGGGAVAIVLLGGGTSGSRVVLALLMAAAAGVILWSLRGTRYVLEDDRLTIEAGPLRWRLAVAGIREIRPCRSLISAPALSSDRLVLAYGDPLRRIQISPQSGAEFITAILGRAQHLQRVGALELVSRARD